MDDVLVVELDAVAVVDVVVRAHPLVPREPARVAPDLEERLQEAALLLDGDVRAEDLLLDLGEVRRLAARAREAREALAEECADLLILLIGTAISADFSLEDAFWAKMDELMDRSSRMVDGRIRVSRFDGVSAPEDG